MMISDAKRFMFVHIYKTGGTSITRLLAPYVEERYRSPQPRTKGLGWQETWHYRGGQHWKLSDLRRDPEWRERDFSQYRVLAFVRNPYSWMLSIWREFYKAADNPAARQFASLHPSRSFPDFCRFIVACRKGLNRAAWGAQPQSTFLTDDQGPNRSIGRFENYEADVRRVLEEVEIYCDQIPHELNVNWNHNISQYYDEESTELIQQHLQEDFELFGYETLLSNLASAGR